MTTSSHSSLLPDPSIPRLCRVGLQLLGIYFLGYLVLILAHLPVGWGVVHSFVQDAYASAKVIDQIGMIPFYTPEELAQYGMQGELIAGSFIALLLATSLFFIAVLPTLLIYGFAPRVAPLLALMLGGLWMVLGRAPGLEAWITLALFFPAPLFLLFLAPWYHGLRGGFRRGDRSTGTPSSEEEVINELAEDLAPLEEPVTND